MVSLEIHDLCLQGCNHNLIHFTGVNEKRKSRRSFFIRLNSNVELRAISSAVLVIPRDQLLHTKKAQLNHRSLFIRIHGLSHSLDFLKGYPDAIKIRKGIIKLDITSILKAKPKTSNGFVRNISIEVVCEKCRTFSAFSRKIKKRRPVVIFRLKSLTKMRKQRSNCAGTCCLQKYMVDFKKLGFFFVMQPKKFALNFCRGSCQPHSPQILFMNRINLLQPSSSSNPNDSCCVVSSFRPLSILYQDDNGSINKKDLPNAVATGCECS